MYYKRYELQWRFNIYFTGSILAGAFSGSLAYGIAHMDGVAGYAGWRWVRLRALLPTSRLADSLLRFLSSKACSPLSRQSSARSSSLTGQRPLHSSALRRNSSSSRASRPTLPTLR